MLVSAPAIPFKPSGRVALLDDGQRVGDGLNLSCNVLHRAPRTVRAALAHRAVTDRLADLLTNLPRRSAARPAPECPSARVVVEFPQPPHRPRRAASPHAAQHRIESNCGISILKFANLVAPFSQRPRLVCSSFFVSIFGSI
jgi:hypothetical protein